MADFKAKMHQIVCRLGLRPRPRWGSLQRSPGPPSWILGGLLLREGRRGEGRGGEGKGTPCSPVTPSSCHYILDKGLVLFSVSSDNSSGYSLLHTHETIHNDTRQTFTRRKTVRRPTCLTISTTLRRQSFIRKSPLAVTHLWVSYGLRPRTARPAALRPFALTSLPPPRVCLLAPDNLDSVMRL